MSVLKSLGAESLFGDVQRMDKRQVKAINRISHSHESYFIFFAVFLSSLELRNDRFVCAHDLEGLDGRHRKWISNCSRAERIHGASLSQRRLIVPHQLPRRACSRRRDCCVQSRRPRHSNRPQSHQTSREVSVAQISSALDERVTIFLLFRSDGTVKFLTKGDNNSVDDRGLYAPGQLWLTKKDIVGRARGFLPYVGMITILMNEYPNFKYAILGILAIYVLLHRE